MTPARKVLTILSWAAWALLLIQLYIWRCDRWELYYRLYHCKPDDYSRVLYRCDGGETIEE